MNCRNNILVNDFTKCQNSVKYHSTSTMINVLMMENLGISDLGTFKHQETRDSVAFLMKSILYNIL